MAYSEAKNIRLILGNPSEEELPGELIALMQRKADAFVDGNLKAAYTVPFATPYPAQIVGWAEDLATFYILKSPYYRLRQPVDTAQIENDRQTAVQEVVACARRKMRLVGVAPLNRTKSTTDDYVPTFGLDDSMDWSLDPDQATAQKNRRKRDSSGSTQL